MAVDHLKYTHIWTCDQKCWTYCWHFVDLVNLCIWFLKDCSKLLPIWSNLRKKIKTKNLWRNCVLKAIKNRKWIFQHTQKLRCKCNSISNVLKYLFCYNSFSLDFQLMKVTEYLYSLIQQTYWSNFYLKKS